MNAGRQYITGGRAIRLGEPSNQHNRILRFSHDARLQAFPCMMMDVGHSTREVVVRRPHDARERPECYEVSRAASFSLSGPTEPLHSATLPLCHILGEWLMLRSPAGLKCCMQPRASDWGRHPRQSGAHGGGHRSWRGGRPRRACVAMGCLFQNTWVWHRNGGDAILPNTLQIPTSPSRKTYVATHRKVESAQIVWLDLRNANRQRCGQEVDGESKCCKNG